MKNTGKQKETECKKKTAHWKKKFLLTALLLLAVSFEAFGVEQLPYDPIYSTSQYVDRSGETEEEQKISSYVQTTWNYYPDLRWTGPWSYIEAGGQKFFYFGCGICCLTNIYDTLTEETTEKSNPSEMYQWCRELSSYNPDSGRGAMDWGQLKTMCDYFGFETKLCRETADFEDFCEDMKEADCLLVLVSKYDDTALWSDTKGHYVTLWEYEEENGTAFVTDSSGLHNRQRVPLSDVWRALKSSSQYQYMTVKKAG